MRSLLVLLLVVPFFTSAQINRSAKELATERIQEYIVNKLFKNKPYKPVSYGEIKSIEHKKSEISWSIAHKFEITGGGESSFQKEAPAQKVYTFLFYLDEKMKVIRAETYYSN